jgi:hypothetical protein
MCSLVISVADITPKASSENVVTSWELALVTAPSSNNSAAASSKMVHITLTLPLFDHLSETKFTFPLFYHHLSEKPNLPSLYSIISQKLN